MLAFPLHNAVFPGPLCHELLFQKHCHAVSLQGEECYLCVTLQFVNIIIYEHYTSETIDTQFHSNRIYSDKFNFSQMAHADLTTESDLEIKIQAGSHGSSKAAPKPSKAAKEPKVEADAKAKLAAKLEVDAKAKPAAKLEAAANLETGRTSFNLANAMPKTKMQNDTSYNNHYTAKEGSKVNKFHYKDGLLYYLFRVSSALYIVHVIHNN